jgi:hypothetical protein
MPVSRTVIEVINLFQVIEMFFYRSDLDESIFRYCQWKKIECWKAAVVLVAEFAIILPIGHPDQFPNSAL